LFYQCAVFGLLERLLPVKFDAHGGATEGAAARLIVGEISSSNEGCVSGSIDEIYFGVLILDCGGCEVEADLASDLFFVKIGWSGSIIDAPKA
jgi:hypothetical protein